MDGAIKMDGATQKMDGATQKMDGVTQKMDGVTQDAPHCRLYMYMQHSDLPSLNVMFVYNILTIQDLLKYMDSIQLLNLEGNPLH